MRPAAYAGTNVLASDADSSLLLAIGCNSYAHIGPLTGAEPDAEGVFRHLTTGEFKHYHSSDSKLLLSPTRADIERELTALLQNHRGTDRLAFYFAGHGVMQDGSFYLCTADTSLDAISMTAFNVSTLFRAICEFCPRQAYIVIDACYSGGLALDLAAVLKSEIVGQSPSFGISILASAAMTEEALENAKGGLFTTRLIDVLVGDLAVGEATPFLGLGDVGRRLTTNMSRMLEQQAPRYWGLSLSGEDRFCINPVYNPEIAATVNSGLGKLTVGDTTARMSTALAREVWREFLSLPECDVDRLRDVFVKVVDSELATPTGLVASTEAIARSFTEAVADGFDPFTLVDIRAAMVSALMPHIASSPEARGAVRIQIGAVASLICNVFDDLTIDIDQHKRNLLSRRSGPSELYYLPLRLAKLLGWIGFLVRANDLEPSLSIPLAKLRALTVKLLTEYGNSVVAVGEDQAPFFLSFLAACKTAGWTAEGEEVVGRLYLDFNENFGRVLENAPSANAIIDYFILKENKPLDAHADFLQVPSELFSVVLLGAVLFELDPAIDTSLIQLDHTHFSFYVPDSYNEFWQVRMETGRTVVLQLGHGIWSINDVRRSWRHVLIGLVEAAARDCLPEAILAAHMMSFVYPDRLPLFVVPQIRAYTSIPRELWPSIARIGSR